ncbi:uncharacterized protein [Ptychodera flava]|uniref:uncharacterized protein n=1 Tax=Ptychodera flava TaxID=63121 RepID=UPI003969E753
MGSSPSSNTAPQESKGHGKKRKQVEIKERDETQTREFKFDDDDGIPDTREIIEGKKKLLAVTEYLKNTRVEDLYTERALDTLLTVDSVLGDFSSYENIPKTKKYGKYLAEIGFPKVFALIWDKLRVPIDQGLNSRHSIKYAFALFEGCKTMIGGLCDQSARFSCELGKAGIIERLVSDLENPRLQPDKISQDSSGMEEDAIYGMLRSSIMCMHNAIKNWPDNKPYFRKANAVNLLHKYLVNCKNRSIRANSLFTLVYIVTEDEYDRISAGEEIDFFIKTLDSALKNSYSHHMCEVGDYTFTAMDIVDGIIRLAANDKNKERLVNRGVLPLLVKLLKPDCTEKENELAAMALWTLSFIENNEEKIQKEPGCVDDLKRLKNSPNQAIQKACEGTLWQLGGMEQQMEMKSLLGDLDGEGEGRVGHVMISYQWDCQKLVVKLKDKLKASGYKVWMDVEKMAGSTLEAMAAAVENADCVLLCMSEKYKDSPSCRTEAEYTYKLRKDFIPIRVQQDYMPDGWLGILIGTKLYFDIYSELSLVETTPKLIKELGDRGKTGKRQSVVGAIQDKPAISGTTTRTQNNSAVETWSPKTVTKWLSDSGLPHMTQYFAGYDGKAVVEMRMMEMRAPEFFYSCLKNEMGFKNLLDLTKFTRALRGVDV